MVSQFVLEKHLVGSMGSKNLRMNTVFNQKENVERVEYSCLEICHVYKIVCWIDRKGDRDQYMSTQKTVLQPQKLCIFFVNNLISSILNRFACLNIM